ncbi:glycosyltransferase family 4 protein [Baekduia soli]|uniref:Glycosyltransferase family 4 protein n=1 Tax=Baekduia soli TaxID=496014 RepID=A0A5B8TZS5_9ACTN|nr:glycosyltransferase [Baekduia soli]QEC46224.1 glycosyltransferase family 4 protein [Baekduia soli]
MRVAFLVPALDLFGGVGIVVGHARRLRARHGVDAVLVLARADRSAGEHAYAGLGELPVLELGEAAGQGFDVAVATWWETVLTLHEVPADRYAYFVQSMEDRFYPPGAPERAAAAMTHDLPVAMITEARWIARQLEELRGDRSGFRVHYVRNGIPKDVFSIPGTLAPSIDGPLRVLVEGSPAVALKGVGEALAAAAAMREPRHVTLVCADRAAAEGARADAVVGPLTATEMAELYGRTDVVLKLSRVEGMAGAPLEGFHRGATCITTPVTGHDEYIADGRNALLTSWDDERGTARLLDLLARDRRLLHELRLAAVRTARSWPSAEQSTAMMALALGRIVAGPSPDPTGAAASMTADIRMTMQRQQAVERDHERLAARMRRVESVLSRGPLGVARRMIAGRR